MNDGQFNLSSEPQKCEHLNIVRIRRPEGDPHYEDLRCAVCNKHMGYGKKPSTIQREQENHRKIILLEPLPLTDWQRTFLTDIKKHSDKLSPRQQAKLDEIFAEHSR